MANPIYADFHVHTHFSPCGKPQATAEAMLRRAHEKGLAALGFADHVTPEPVPGCSFYDRQRPHILADLRAEIARATNGAHLEVLVGAEADYTIAGRRCLDATVLAQADHVICAASHFHLPTAPLPASAGLMLRLAREALVLPGVSIWAHPFHCSQVRPLPPMLDPVGEAELAALIALANRREVAIEINGAAVQREDYRQATGRFFRLAHEMSTRFTVTADAHSPDRLDRIDTALAWARTLGLQDDDLLTAQELAQRQSSKLAASLIR
jgi:histidinol phosphatase-like PHP family hydrolase